VDDGIIDSGSTRAEDILPVVDIAFICLPLQASIDYVMENRRHFRVGSIVTDVGSVKGEIVQALRQPLLDHGVYFLGGHPMAGSEKSGLAACNPALYEGAVVFLTPTPDDDAEMIDLVAEFWRAVGAIPLELPAAEHDAAVAHSSHMLHVVAAALTDAVLRRGNHEAQAVASAGGFRDMSRIAASNVEMWTDICQHNREATLEALDHFESELAEFRQAIEMSDWEAVARRFASARDARQAWFATHGAKRGYEP
jgi:prephenate dehydrogenase